MSELALLRAEVESGLHDFNAAGEDGARESANDGSVLRFNNLKLAASEQAPRVCMGVLEVIGIMAYKNDSPYGVGRHLRDTLSARLMVANERIHAIDAGCWRSRRRSRTMSVEVRRRRPTRRRS